MKLTQVVPYDPKIIQTENITDQDVEIPNEEDPVQAEKLKMLANAQGRFQEFANILYNRQGQELKYYVSFYGFGGVLLGILTNLLTTLLPMRDPIENPAFLTDLWPTKLVVGPILATANNLLLFRYFTNTRCLSTLKHFGLALLLIILIGTFVIALMSGVWVKILGYSPPLPFQQSIGGSTSVLFQTMSLLSIIPNQWRQNKDFRRRYKFFLGNTLLITLMYNEYVALGLLFVAVPDEYQWILAILLPFVRELNSWIQEKLGHKAAGANDTSVTIVAAHVVNTRHCVFLCAVIGNTTTNASSSIILGADFIYNLYLALKIVWIKKKKCNSERNDQKMFELLLTLTINELVEVVVPLTYLVCFLSAYYGPNAEIIGGVKSTHFHYEPVTNIYGFIENIMLFMMVDIVSVIFVGSTLWVYCKINLIRAYMTILKEFWPIITLTTAYSIYAVMI